ncbi:MAG: YkvA family protein [Alphaproteobacteria bacterium]
MDQMTPNLPALAAPAREGENRRKVNEGFWPKMKRFAARIPFAPEAVASYYAVADPNTPRRVKLLILAALAYFVAPTDAVPDFIAGLGFTDDATVFWAVWAMAKDHVTDEHRARARDALSVESSGETDGKSV